MFLRPKVWNRHLDDAYRRLVQALDTPHPLSDLPILAPSPVSCYVDTSKIIQEASVQPPSCSVVQFKQEAYELDAYLRAHCFCTETFTYLDHTEHTGLVWRVTNEKGDQTAYVALTVLLTPKAHKFPVMTVYI